MSLVLSLGSKDLYISVVLNLFGSRHTILYSAFPRHVLNKAEDFVIDNKNNNFTVKVNMIRLMNIFLFFSQNKYRVKLFQLLLLPAKSQNLRSFAEHLENLAAAQRLRTTCMFEVLFIV